MKCADRSAARYAAFSPCISRLLRVLCLTAGILLLLCGIPTAYGTEDAEIPTAIPLLAPAPEAGSLPLDTFRDGKLPGWLGEKNITRLALRQTDGAACLHATATPGISSGSYTVMRLFTGDGRLNLLNRSRITAALKIEGTAEVMYTVSLSVHSGLSTHTVTAEIPGGSWYAVSADISAFHQRTAVDAVEIRVDDIWDGGVSSLVIGSLTAGGNPSLEMADAFLTLGFTADGGTAEYEDGAYLLDPGSDGVMTLLADAARYDYSAADGTAALQVVISNAREGGTVSLAVSDSFSDASAFAISSSCQLYFGTNTYLLPFDASLPLYAYRLSFHGLYADSYSTDGVHLLAVSLIHLPGAEPTETLGKITDCSFSDDLASLTVTGTIPNATAAKYIDSTLALYEIPVWSDLETVLKTEEPVARLKISTRFSFTADRKGQEATAAVSRYAVVLQTGTENLPISDALFPDMPTGEKRPFRSAVGLTGADAAGVFTANAANVIVDVHVDELLGGTDGNTSGRLCIRGGRYYYLDFAYLRKLDDEINFYMAADVDVYLRFLSKTDLSCRGFTFSRDDASFFAFDVTNEDGAYMLSAVTDYLASRYGKVRGFILGDRLDSAVYNGADMTDAYAYAALIADTMRIIHTAAAVHIPDATVIAPLGHYLFETSFRTAKENTVCDPVLLSVYLSRHIEAAGGMPWGMLYVSDNAAEMVGHAENILGRMKAVNAAVPEEFFLLWKPSDVYSTDALLSEYQQWGMAASRLNTRVFFLDAAQQRQPDLLYDALKYVEISGDTGRRLQEFSARIDTNVQTTPLHSGVYTLYDFRKSFSTMHWIAGSGCSTLTTQAGRITESERTMHAEFSSETDDPFAAANGSILCMMPAALDFTAAPTVRCTLLATSSLESTDTAQLVFVFGSDDARAAYGITVPVGQPVTVICDLSGYEDASHITSAAILVRADSAITLDIAGMQCFSDTHTSEELAEHFTRSLSGLGTETDHGTLSVRQAALIIAIFVSTLSVFALLTRRQRSREDL